MSGTGITVLDCYDSQVHNDDMRLNGATNTDATHYRKVQSSSSCSTPFAGKDGTGANFVYTGGNRQVFRLNETWSRVQQVCARYNGDNGLDSYTFWLDQASAKISHNVVFNSANASNDGMGINMTANLNLAYACIVYGGDSNGINIDVGGGNTAGVICCTSVDNALVGITSGSAGGTAIAFSNYGMDNTGNEFSESNWDAPSGWNGADDTTADLGGTAGDNYKNSVDYDASLDADYLATANISANGGAGDRCGRNPYNDVTATTDFDDFLRNDTGGDPLFKYDIAGNERPNEDVADAVWDVGASEFVGAPPAGVAPTAALQGPLFGPLGGPI